MDLDEQIRFLFRDLTENIDVMFWASSPDQSRVLYVSPAYETITGRTCEEVYEDGRAWLQTIHPDDVEFMLSAGATQEAFRRVLRYAYAAGASGFLAGRAIWWQAAQAFPDMEAMRGHLSVDSVPYMQAINRLTDELATPWTERAGVLGDPALDRAAPMFRAEYEEIL